ncbi:sugar diacid recognition domain-containing protein [Roseburia hominis]
MFISKIVAQAIVEEIGEEIHEHINMMDAQGVIIASTDPSRIGQIHKGARKIITEGLTELYISDEMETDTTKKGINLPLIVRGEIIGVVGITGEKNRVMGYGNIVRRMTEILVMDSIQKDVKRYDRRVRYRFIQEWIEKSNTSYSRNLIDRGHHLGIDIEKPYRAMVIYFPDYQQLSDTLEGQKLLEEMEVSIRHEMERSKVLYLRQPPKQVCLLSIRSDEEMRLAAEKLQKLIKEKYGKDIAVGIDSNRGDRRNIGQRCVEAEKAAAHAMLWGKYFYSYQDMNIELFLNEISEGTMTEYLEKLFIKIPVEKWADYIQLIEYYFAYEGSITKMAEALYMHKNTLQYKLKKLAEVTGKDIRQLSNAPIFYMALAFYRKLHLNRS